MNGLRAPFPYFGGKSTIAADVWARFGRVQRYIEPFFGSGAVLLGRPETMRGGLELVNDLDGHLVNVWRSVKLKPDEVLAHLDWPISELDLHARRRVLQREEQSLSDRMREDPDLCDAKLAAWWVWGFSQWIGGGFIDELSYGRRPSHEPKGIFGQQDNGSRLASLSDRLRRVQIYCGDWSRVVTGAVLREASGHLCGIFLDPPYVATDRANCYRHEDFDVGHAVRQWCLDNGDNPNLRIAVCDYDGMHELSGWSKFGWKTQGGMGNRSNKQGRANKERETIWFSPHCLEHEQLGLAL